MFWTERLFQLIPIGRERGSFASFLAVRLIRSLCLTFILFLIGVLAVLIQGTSTLAQDPRSLIAYGYFFACVFLAFVVSGWFHSKWDWFFGWSSHIIKLSETEFGKFRDRMEKFINSSFACLIIALPFFIQFLMYSFPLFIKDWGAIMFVYMAFVNFFMILFFGTLIWYIVSMWITFYVTLRQPLSLKLSPRTNEEFQPLAIWGLKILFVALVVVAIIFVFYNLGIVFSPGGFAGLVGSMSFIVVLGVIAFLLPFYHVHRVLVKLKKRELLEIEGESNRLMQDLAQTAFNNDALHSEENMTQIMNSQRALVSLQVLQIRERRAREADEWPIDTTILSILAGIVLVPIISQIIINLLSTIFAS
jgi:hypothetical protein